MMPSNYTVILNDITIMWLLFFARLPVNVGGRMSDWVQANDGIMVACGLAVGLVAWVAMWLCVIKLCSHVDPSEESEKGVSDETTK